MDKTSKNNNNKKCNKAVENTRENTFYDYLFVCCITQIYTFSFFFRQAIAPIADVLEDDFHATTSQIGLCSSLLFVGYFTMQIPSGIILQIYSPEFISLLCSLFMSICSAVFAFAPNIQIATATQLIAGIAQAPIAISVLSIIDKRLGNDAVSLGFGCAKCYSYFFLISIQYAQAYVYETYYVWKPLFYSCSIGCILFSMFILVALLLESNIKSHPNDDKIEISMQKLRNNSQTIATPLIRIHDNITHKFNSSKCICFPTKNSDNKTSNTNNSVITSLKYALKNCMNFIFAIYGFFLVFILYGVYGLWLISYLMIKFKFQRPTATLISSSFYISSAISGTVWGFLSTKYKRRKIFLIFGVIFMCCSIITIYVNVSVHWIIIALSSILSGIGFGGQNPIFWASVRELNAYYHCCDVAIGVINTVTNSSGFASQFLIGSLMDMHWSNIRGGNDFDKDGDRNYNQSDYQFAFTTIPICLIIAFILSFFIRETYAKPIDYSTHS